jgi:hypothetical protein
MFTLGRKIRRKEGTENKEKKKPDDKIIWG